MSAFAQRVSREARRRGFEHATRRVVLGDGAPWIWMGYLRNNQDRMRYPAFREQGLCVSTGVVEAGCKVAIGTRMKRAGMRWTVAGADAIIALRCCRLSGRFEDFWARRSAQQQAASSGSR